MTTPEDNPTRRRLTRTYHAICRQLGMTADERLTLLHSYGVQTSLQLDTRQLYNLVETLRSRLPPQDDRQKLADLRRRIYAAIGQYLKKQGKTSGPDIIRAIACRAAGTQNFTDIPPGMLTSLIYAFNHKTQVMQAVEDIHRENDTPQSQYIYIHSKNI